MMNDTLATALSVILNSEQIGRKDCLITPVSKVTSKIIQLLNEKGYIGVGEEITKARGGLFKINLLGRINKIGVIKPRFAVSLDTYEKFEKRYLPAKGVGFLIVSTSQGLMVHEESKTKGIGGRLIAYCY
mgnify:CR=1 FL=1